MQNTSTVAFSTCFHFLLLKIKEQSLKAYCYKLKKDMTKIEYTFHPILAQFLRLKEALNNAVKHYSLFVGIKT